jgi:hypothetical protein
MCWPTSNINSDINGTRRNVYLVTWWNHRSHNNGYPKHHNDLYSNVYGGGLSSSYRYRNGNNQPTSTNNGNLVCLFGLNVAISECSNSRHMEQLEYGSSHDNSIRSSNGSEPRNEHDNIQRIKWMQYDESIYRISTTGINSNPK